MDVANSITSNAASKLEPETSSVATDVHTSLILSSTTSNIVNDSEKLFYHNSSSPNYTSDIDMDTPVLSPMEFDIDGNRLSKLSRKEVAKFQCTDCSFVTSKLEVFDDHVATHKNSEKEHECHVCQQKFKYKQSVKKHMMKHEGITPYHCPICEYKTNSHSSLEVHQRAHSGEKPFICDSCGMRFAQNSQLRVHMQYHSNANNPYKCELCDYQSPNYYKLTRHMKVHRERPYSCDLCNKKFMLPYQLRNHAATHVKDPDAPFACHTCKETFTDKSVYKKHIRESHGMKPGPKPGSSKFSTPINSPMSMDISAPPMKPTAVTATTTGLYVNQNTSFAPVTSVQSLVTAINHGNKTVSRILHLPVSSMSQSDSSVAPTMVKYTTVPTHDLTCNTVLSPGLSSAVGKMSVTSTGSMEHETDWKEDDDASNPELHGDIPDDVVIIKPEAAPSGDNGFISDFSEWKNLSGTNPSSITPTSGSEHSTSAQVSPILKMESTETSAELIQSRMSTIFDKLLFRATADAESVVPVNESCTALDLSLPTPVKSEPIKSESELSIDDDELSYDQILDFSDHQSEDAPIAKVAKILPDEQAIIKTGNQDRPYKCGYCSKQFIQSSHIRVHLQYHVNATNPFRCSECSYTSASKYKLNLHLKVHRERRFVCLHCPSKFTLNCRLNQHVKVAHGEDLPFKCTLCNVTFSSTNLLSWHVSNKHENPTQTLNASIAAQKLLVSFQ